MRISYNYNIKGELVNEGLFLTKYDLEMLLDKIELSNKQGFKWSFKGLIVALKQLNQLKTKIKP